MFRQYKYDEFDVINDMYQTHHIYADTKLKYIKRGDVNDRKFVNENETSIFIQRSIKVLSHCQTENVLATE